MLYRGLRACSVPTAKQESGRAMQALLHEHLPGEAVLEPVLRHKDSLLGHGGKSRHFIHAVSSRSADTHSATARRPRAQSFFTTQMSTRGDRQKQSKETTLRKYGDQKRCQKKQGLAALFPPQVLSSRVCLKRQLEKTNKNQNLIYQH